MLSNDMKEELVQGLTETFQRNRSAIILYGSVARGEAADMDIRYERAFSTVDIQEENMKQWERVLPFYQNIRKEGIALWKAA